MNGNRSTRGADPRWGGYNPVPAGMKRIQTNRFGEIDIVRDRIIRFDRGISVNECHAKRFTLLAHESRAAMLWMQAVNEPSMSFLVADPLAFLTTEYTPEGPNDHLDPEGNTAILVTAWVNKEDGWLYGDLSNPLVINQQTRVGRRWWDPQWSSEMRLMDMREIQSADQKESE